MIEPFAAELVRGFLHRPEQPSGDAIVLTHGAGSNCQAPLLVELAREFATAGLLALRCDLPFRQSRPSGPPSPGGAAKDREGLRAAVDAVRQIAKGRAYLGGHSYGGRQATMLAAANPNVADALLLLSYPLHPPPPGRAADSALPQAPHSGNLCARVTRPFWNSGGDAGGAGAHPQSHRIGRSRGRWA